MPAVATSSLIDLVTETSFFHVSCNGREREVNPSNKSM